MTATLTRPVAPGTPITLWTLSTTHESRYDVADQPMSGEMDPFFFVTKHKNFIPHEYPCRTQFAGERRGRRPVVAGSPATERVWLPFGSPRVDLSGFWFRPTVIATHAVTTLNAQVAGHARVRLATCGGAIVWVNGIDAGFMAPYGRNLETDKVFDLELRAGANEIRVFFDDLAERDARYYFQLDYLDGPAVTVSIPGGHREGVADAIETLLSTMHFEQAAYRSGPVAFHLPHPLPFAADAHIAIEGDFMSTERFDLTASLAAGADRLVVGDVADLPSDFRHFKVTLTADGFSAARVFGVEISQADRQGAAPADLAARITEALDWVSEHAEPDTVTAIARLATGRGGARTDAMIEAMLPAIEDCHDCADFILVPLLWSRTRQANAIAPALLARIDAAILGYRYWMDEPGNDVQWYFSENHALLFHTAAYLAGHLFPEARFVRSGRLGHEQSEVGAGRVRAWLDHFEAWEMAEFNSAPYFPIDLKGLSALYALSPDADIRARAGAAIIRLLRVVAASAHQGVLTGAQGRSYEHTLRAGRTLELSALGRLAWGQGHFGRRYHALPQIALCVRDHGLMIPEDLASEACLAAGTAREWTFAQGQDRFAKLYHHKTRDHAMGSAAGYRWHQWGYQETVIHARFGDNADAQVWINHPGELIHSGYARPSYWGGSATLPRVHQYRDLAIVDFRGHAGQPDLTHAWFPTTAFDAFTIDERVAAAMNGAGYVLLKGSSPLHWVRLGPTANHELRMVGHTGRWIVRLGSAGKHGHFDAFSRRFAAIEMMDEADGTIILDDPDYGRVRCRPDGSTQAEGRVIDPATFTVEGALSRLPDGLLTPARPVAMPVA